MNKHIWVWIVVRIQPPPLHARFQYSFADTLRPRYEVAFNRQAWKQSHELLTSLTKHSIIFPRPTELCLLPDGRITFVGPTLDEIIQTFLSQRNLTTPPNDVWMFE